jgi:hypothetical protein
MNEVWINNLRKKLSDFLNIEYDESLYAAKIEESKTIKFKQKKTFYKNLVFKSMIFTNAKGQTIGLLHEDNIYRSKRKGSKHILRIMDAWGIDKAVYDSLLKQGCTELRIKDEEDNKVYSVSMNIFDKFSVTRDFDGEQMFLSRKFWTVKKLQDNKR